MFSYVSLNCILTYLASIMHYGEVEGIAFWPHIAGVSDIVVELFN